MWVIVRCPFDLQEYDVEGVIKLGGVGDDVSEVYETYEQVYRWDFIS